MGFNKRFLDTPKIKEYVDNGYSFSDIFKADAIIFMDNFSSKLFKFYNEGYTDKQLKKLVVDGKRKKD